MREDPSMRAGGRRAAVHASTMIFRRRTCSSFFKIIFLFHVLHRRNQLICRVLEQRANPPLCLDKKTQIMINRPSFRQCDVLIYRAKQTDRLCGGGRRLAIQFVTSKIHCCSRSNFLPVTWFRNCQQSRFRNLSNVLSARNAFATDKQLTVQIHFRKHSSTISFF